MSHYSFSLRSLLLGGLSLGLTLGLIACDNTVQDNDPVTNAPARVDLLECGVQLSCPAYCAHLSIEPCSGGGGPEMMQCAGDLWLQGGRGAIELHDEPGPGYWQGDTLTLLLGDGKALVQQRTRTCDSCKIETLPWELGAHELCDVKAPPATCQPDNCTWLPQVENCVPVETDWTCEEAAAAISPAP